ncbi:MAG: HAD family phosphatase [Planctomycetaceae bacterium]|nr:MAG: HAD family phosphatase [Planctomycetaceae bacterium]
MAKRELSDSEFQEMSDWKENRYRELIAGKLELLAGAERLIKDLKNSGFALAIGSSTPRSNLEFMLKNLPIEKYFDAMVVGEDVKNGKPAPDTFLKAAEKLDIAPEYCVVVEDAVQGLKAAKNAGMAVVAVTTTRSRDDLTIADMIVDSLEELSARDFERLLDRI